MALEAGSKLGPYEIISLTGAGGMGEVYKAKDSRLDRIVAIKVLPSHLTASEDIKQRFEREAKTISSLNHPNICILHDIGEQDGIAYLVMEFLEGQTLSDRIAEGPLSNDELMKYSLQIVDALDKAHKQGLIHRDLKPSNVMLTKEGAKLLDFGLAKLQVPTGGFEHTSGATRTSTPLTQQGTILGTIQYMSPEQLEGAEADARSDIFAFGGVLFEMVTGQKAFQGKSQASLIASVLKEQPRSVSEIQPLAPPMFDRIIKRCLAKEPEDRWQTAGDLKHAIEWIGDGGSQVGIPKVVSSKRKRNAIVSMTLAAIFFLSTLYLSYIHFSQPQDEKQVARFTLEVGQGLRSISWPRVSPDGKLVAFRATDSIGVRQIWVRPISSLDAYPLFGTEGVDRHYWSPDSKFLTFFKGNKLMKLPVTGGQAQLLADGVDGADCSWGSKDRILFDGATGDPIRLVSANGGDIITTAEVDTGNGESFIGWPWFLPDGEHFLFIADFIDSTNRTTSSIKVGAVNSPDSKLLYRLRTSGRIEYASPGYILFVQDNNLMALPFDTDKLEVTGEAKPIAQEISFSQNAEEFSMSDNGTLLYHSSSTNATSQFVWVDREGNEIEKVGAIGNYFDANLSPDGSKFTYAVQEDGSTSNIWIYDLVRNVPTKFTFDPKDETWPIWSPDGQKILYASNKEGNYAIWEKDVNGLQEAALLYSNDSGQAGANCFTPDGSRLLFTFLKSNRDIGILNLGDSNRVDMFANSSYSEEMPSLSPNGQYVAYLSSESGRAEIYVRQLDGRGGKWQISKNGGAFPRWSGNGKELYYYAFAANEITAVPVSTEGNFEAGNAAPLFKAVLQSRIGFQIGPYDVTSDGQKFLLNQSLTGVSLKTMILVLNITEEI